MKVTLTSESEFDVRDVTVGFDWPSFFSGWIFGIPHFFRGMYAFPIGFSVIAFLMTLETLVNYTTDRVEYREAENLGLLLTLVLYLILSIYLGIKGSELHAKHLLRKGYVFEAPDSEEVKHAKARWQIPH